MSYSLTPSEIASVIGIPVKRWPGNCHCIALAMLDAKIVRGKSRYGHYHGYIDPDSIFGHRQFSHHGWIERRATIVDPTRWVFENVTPYIYIGPKRDPDYDVGGNRLRKLFLQPPPKFDNRQKVFDLPFDLAAFAQLMLGQDSDEVCAEQVMWLVSLPLDMLDGYAKPLYEWVRDDVKMPGFIPIDNRREVLKETR